MAVEFADLSTALDQGIFDVYLGLTASGYDLANPTRVGAMRDALLTENWSGETLQYFGVARINDGRINPYWPRASLLATASLLINRSPVADHGALIQAYFSTLDNISPAEADKALICWAASLPKQTAVIQASQTYAKAWECYQQTVRREIGEHGGRFQQEMIAAQGWLCVLLPPSASSPPLVTILNPLQADALTDVVNVHDQVYVVTSHLRAESAIHELIHILLSPWLRVWEERIATSASLLELVYDRMAYLTYAWDCSAASWKNVFSETLVRVLTAFVSSNGHPEAHIRDLVQQGFVYALPIAETMATLGTDESLSEAWLDRCLCACAGLTKHS